MTARLRLALSLLIVATAALLWLLPEGDGQQLAAASLLWGWPALSWFLRQRGSAGERFLLAAGLALLLHALLALLLLYLPGPLPRWALVAAALFVALLPLAWPLRQVSRRPRLPVRLWQWGALLLVLTVALRLPNLGYKELQGDEGVVMVRAAAALTGDDAELFLHQKGPVEILLPMLVWGATGAITESWARLPFLWSGILAVGAVTLLARRWFGREAGLLAGLLFAVSGFSVAFARIIQYQSLVMLWGGLALIGADRYRRSGRPADLLLAVAFLAGGLLAHYDAVLVAPALAWLLGVRLWRERRLDVPAWAGAVLAGAGILALFYVPFLLNPNFARTGRYLLGARLGAGDGSLLGWSGAAVWQMVTFYNSLYYAVVLALLILAGLGYLRLKSVAGTAALLHFSVPLCFYTFVVADPRTHVYTLFPGAAILAAVGIIALWQRLPARAGRPLFAAFLALFFSVSALYLYLMFVDVSLERQRTWAVNRPPLYPVTWQAPPLYGLFGFPYQAGWRAVAALPLSWPYASNEEAEVTAYYLAHAPRTYCADFDTFVQAENVQDAIPYPPDWLAAFSPHYQITVNGRPTATVYSRRSPDSAVTVEAASRRLWRTPAEVAPPQSGGAYPVDIVLGEQIQLLGYDLDNRDARPGGQVVVTLYWQALVPLERNYQVFVHLYDGQMWGQHDGAPACDVQPTTHWEPGRVVADSHLIPVAADTPPGSIPLLVGMYDLLSQERLPVPGSPDNVIHLTDISLGRSQVGQ